MDRSWLYVPSDQPTLYPKALRSGTDACILDLEDSVSPANKQAGRENVRALLAEPAEITRAVRINADTWVEDLKWIAGADEIIVPKATLALLEDISALLSETLQPPPLVALIESALGFTQIRSIAALPQVSRLALGEADLCADLGMTPSEDGAELLSIRVEVVIASAAAAKQAPTAPVSTRFDDLDAFARSCERLAMLGFGGRSAIHPHQIAPINQHFTPSPAQQAWAREVIDAANRSGGGATTGPDGSMIDLAVVRRAEAIIKRTARSAS